MEDSFTERCGGVKNKEVCHCGLVAQHRPQKQMPHLRFLLLLETRVFFQRYNQVKYGKYRIANS